VSRRITRLWRCAGLEVQAFEDPGQALESMDGVSLIGADEFDRDLVLEALRRYSEARAVLWTAEPLDRLVRFALEHPRVSNLLGRADFQSTPRDWELLMVAYRLMHPGAGSPPFESYMRWGAQGFDGLVSGTEPMDAAVHTVQTFVDGIGAPSWVSQTFSELAHELLMNALYTAPVDDAGRQRYAHDRKALIVLPSHESPTLRVASDGALLCMQVTDPFGRLTREHVFRGLARGLRNGEIDSSGGGAGLGLAASLLASVVLIFDVERERKTEVTGIFDLDLNRRQFRDRAKSLHYFEHEVAP
jgi:hypothetical protein